MEVRTICGLIAPFFFHPVSRPRSFLKHSSSLPHILLPTLHFSLPLPLYCLHSLSVSLSSSTCTGIAPLILKLPHLLLSASCHITSCFWVKHTAFKQKRSPTPLPGGNPLFLSNGGLYINVLWRELCKKSHRHQAPQLSSVQSAHSCFCTHCEQVAEALWFETRTSMGDYGWLLNVAPGGLFDWLVSRDAS